MRDGFQITGEVDLATIKTAQDVEDTIHAHRGLVFAYNGMLDVYAVQHLRLAAMGEVCIIDWPQLLMHHQNIPRSFTLAQLNPVVDVDELATMLEDITSFCRTHLSVEVELSAPTEGDGGGEIRTIVTLEYIPPEPEDDALTASSGADDDDAPPSSDESWALLVAEADEGLDADERATLEDDDPAAA
jgi:hypothetical protein